MISRTSIRIVLFLSLSTLNCIDSSSPSEITTDGSVESHFSAQQGIEWILEKHIDESAESIDAAIYTFTSRPLAQALVDAKKRGVKIRLVVDPSHASTDYSKGPYLANNGINIRVERGAGLMHHKFAVIDDTILITGSYNWTASAENVNDENILLLTGFPKLIRSYRREFNRLWEQSVEFTEKMPETCELSARAPRELQKHIWEHVKVCGKVVRVGYSDRSNTYFLNFTSEEEGFTAVIFSSAVDKFSNLGLSIPDFDGEYLGITGELIDHPEYGLEIIVEEPSQIEIMK